MAVSRLNSADLSSVFAELNKSKKHQFLKTLLLKYLKTIVNNLPFSNTEAQIIYRQLTNLQSTHPIFAILATDFSETNQTKYIKEFIAEYITDTDRQSVIDLIDSFECSNISEAQKNHEAICSTLLGLHAHQNEIIILTEQYQKAETEIQKERIGLPLARMQYVFAEACYAKKENLEKAKQYLESAYHFFATLKIKHKDISNLDEYYLSSFRTIHNKINLEIYMNKFHELKNNLEHELANSKPINDKLPSKYQIQYKFCSRLKKMIDAINNNDPIFYPLLFIMHQTLGSSYSHCQNQSMVIQHYRIALEYGKSILSSANQNNGLLKTYLHLALHIFKYFVSQANEKSYSPDWTFIQYDSAMKIIKNHLLPYQQLLPNHAAFQNAIIETNFFPRYMTVLLEKVEMLTKQKKYQQALDLINTAQNDTNNIFDDTIKKQLQPFKEKLAQLQATLTETIKTLPALPTVSTMSLTVFSVAMPSQTQKTDTTHTPQLR